MYGEEASSSCATGKRRGKYRDVFGAPSQGWDAADECHGLDLSIHNPPRPFGNRYEILSRPLSSCKRDRDEQNRRPPALSTRRSQRARNYKEGKRRQDGRRSKRRLAAIQRLDEELSRQFDASLRQFDVQWPLPSPSTPRTQKPYFSNVPTNGQSLSLPEPQQHFGYSPVAPPAPDPPYFNFAGLGLMDEMPPLPPRPPSSVKLEQPVRMSPMLPPIPKWCPQLPAFMNKDIALDRFPLFFDLSQLPETLDELSSLPSRKKVDQEMQLWRTPKLGPQPRKHSRFFPPQKPVVKPPPSSSACKLHDMERESEHLVAPNRNNLPMRARPWSFKAVDKPRTPSVEPSAANLWKLLTSNESPRANDYDDDFAFVHVPDTSAMPYVVRDHRLHGMGTPSELDSAEIPFVHGNSLVGFSSERTDSGLPKSDDESCIPVFESHNTGYVHPASLNGLMIDPYSSTEDERYAAAVLEALDFLSLPPLPPSPVLERSVPEQPLPEPALSPLPAVFPAACDSSTYCDAEEDLGSTAQHDSEKALFAAPSPIRISAASKDCVDSAADSVRDHLPDCWCRAC